jgi:hypothetical protein
MLPGDFDYAELIGQCRDFAEMTGKAGDVVLLHPFTLHATSQSVLGVARFITNPALALREPMNFNRPDAQDFSWWNARFCAGWASIASISFPPRRGRAWCPSGCTGSGRGRPRKVRGWPPPNAPRKCRAGSLPPAPGSGYTGNVLVAGRRRELDEIGRLLDGAPGHGRHASHLRPGGVG